jgi:hypothetical protein
MVDGVWFACPVQVECPARLDFWALWSRETEWFM